jgi:hypothetical protein
VHLSYGTSEIIARSLVETKSTEDAFNSNIAKLVSNSQCGSELIQIVNKQMKLGESNRSLSTTLAHASTYNALIQGFLWIIVTSVFVVMLLKLKHNQKEKN